MTDVTTLVDAIARDQKQSAALRDDPEALTWWDERHFERRLELLSEQCPERPALPAPPARATAVEPPEELPEPPVPLDEGAIRAQGGGRRRG